MFHITCKGQNGVVKSFFPISTRTATRASQWLAAPSGCGARLRAPALPRTAVREEAPGTAGGRLGLHQAWWGGGRGAGGPGARFRGLRGRGRRFGERGPDPDSGSGARGGQPRAAGGARPRRGGGRAAGRVRGGRARGAATPGGNLLTHLRQRLRVRPLRAEDACPRVASSETRAGG